MKSSPPVAEEKTCNSVNVPNLIDNNENCLNHNGDVPSVILENNFNVNSNEKPNHDGDKKNDAKPAEPVLVKMEVEEDHDVKREMKSGVDCRRYQRGWTIKDCGSLSIGDLYLMVRS